MIETYPPIRIPKDDDDGWFAKIRASHIAGAFVVLLGVGMIVYGLLADSNVSELTILMLN
jgi:hypothetical protein